ncbi:efflux RND transporter periplasmic adaptor subunit [Salinihabitans flavidus]|nr:efflux RND transporter periplasmic adaptor subunit [Salinihabitans flavidus]
MILSVLVLAGALYLWIAYVPSARPMLDRLGVSELLGIEVAQNEEENGAGPGFGGGATRVVVEEVTERTLADRVRAIGDGQARRAVVVRSETVGLVTELHVAPGGQVDSGQVVAQLQNEAETIALERAQIMVEDATDNLRRLRQLEGTVTEVRLREAELALRTAQLELRQARLDLAQREILAPISGRVGIIDVEVGERVAAQEALFTITDRSALLIDFRVPERVISQLSVGMPVTVTPLGLRGTVLNGEISAVDTIVDRASRTLRVQGRVENSEDLLRVGMAFEVEMSFPGETLVSIAPLALQWSSEGAFVWAVREGKAARVPVEIRQRNADSVLVEADLAPGEAIVTEGVQNLRPGAAVEVANGRDEVRATWTPDRPVRTE